MSGLIAFFADTGLMILVGLAAVLGLYWLFTTKKSFSKIVPYVILAGLTSLLVGKLASLLPVQSVRPFVEHGVAAGASYINNPGFPSDHMLLATIIVGTVYTLTAYKKWSYLLIGLGLLIGVARILAFVHTPLDIVGGLIAGVLGMLWYKKAQAQNVL